jgi:hypothetical protein
MEYCFSSLYLVIRNFKSFKITKYAETNSTHVSVFRIASVFLFEIRCYISFVNSWSDKRFIPVILQ